MRTRVILVFGRAASVSRGMARQAAGAAASDFRNDLRFIDESLRSDEPGIPDSGYSVWRAWAKAGRSRISRPASSKHRAQLALASELIPWPSHLSKVGGAARFGGTAGRAAGPCRP